MPEPTQPPLGTLALATMHQQDEARGIDPTTPSPLIPAEPPPPPQPAVIPRPDWQAEQRERQAIEAERHRQALAAELERLAPEDTQTAPAPKRRRGWRT